MLNTKGAVLNNTLRRVLDVTHSKTGSYEILDTE